MRNLLVILLVLGGGGYFIYSQYIAPDLRARAAVEQVLDKASELAQAGDAARIHAFLDSHLTSDARVTLEITFGVLSGQAPAARMQYTKESFLQFMDGVLARTRDWEVRMAIADLSSFSFKDAMGAKIRLTGQQQGTASDGTIIMRYIAMVECNTDVLFAAEPVFSKADCTIRLQGMPRGAAGSGLF